MNYGDFGIASFSCCHLTSKATKRLESQSDVELPPDLSLQKPLEETSLTKNMTVHVEPASDTTDHNKSIEAQMPVEESWLDTAVDTATSSAVVSSLTSFTAQQQRVVTSVVSVLPLCGTQCLTCHFIFRMTQPLKKST